MDQNKKCYKIICGVIILVHIFVTQIGNDSAVSKYLDFQAGDQSSIPSNQACSFNFFQTSADLISILLSYLMEEAIPPTLTVSRTSDRRPVFYADPTKWDKGR